MREYDIDLMGLNDDLYHAYIESHTGTGGERRVVYLRQHDKGIPITLRENYSDDGFLRAETYERDARTVENELLKIRQLSNQGGKYLRTTSTAHKRTRCYSKTIPKTRRISKTKTKLDKPYSMRRKFANRKSGYRSQFELSLARSLKEKTYRLNTKQND